MIRRTRLLSAAAALALTCGAHAQSTTYQGKLMNFGAPESGPVNFGFRLYDDAVAGGQVGSELTVLGFSDFGSGGEFVVDLDFGSGAFDGAARWLEVWVNGAPLSPRQPIRATPYALHAASAASAASVPDGALPGSYTGTVDFSNAGNQFAGSGAGLTGLNASSIATGTLADARLSSNVALLNLPPTFNSSVNASDPSQASFRTLSSTFGGMYFANNSGIAQGSISFAHGADELRIANRVGTLGGTFHEIILRDDGTTTFPGDIGIGTTNPVNRLTIDGSADINGNLGIGTTAPQRELDVEAPEAMLRLTATDTTIGKTSRLQFKGSSNPSPFHQLGAIEFYNDQDELRATINTSKSGPTGAQMSFNVTPGDVYQLLLGNDLARVAGTLEVRDTILNASAQIGSGGEDSYFQLQGGNFGIGTDTPVAPLNVIAFDETAIRAETNVQSTAAIFGGNDASPGFAAGIWGGTQGFGCAGLYGTAGNGESAYGVYGWAGTATTNYGVYGRTSSATGYGVYSLGRMHVNGTLSKSGGAFRIDHPLDPENKELWHSFVESPDMMNIYNGNVVTDGEGYAVVTMPEYFEALNRDFRYQLTVVEDDDSDSFVLAKIAHKLKAGQFTIRTSEPRAEVSWQVTGVRQDPWAEANRIPNEVEKRDEDKGLYLNPEAYGLPREMGVDFRAMPELASPPIQDDNEPEVTEVSQ